MWDTTRSDGSGFLYRGAKCNRACTKPARAPPQAALEPEAVPVAQPEAKGDLRIATILFADVSGFTAMSETLEAEDVADIMNMVFDRLTDVIVGEGGTIDKYIGDCVMAIFGAPRSYGDDGERAVRAGLRMQVVLGELAEEIELASHQAADADWSQYRTGTCWLRGWQGSRSLYGDGRCGELGESLRISL